MLSVYICPSDDGPSLVPVFGNPPDPANPGTYTARHVVDTVARGNYVGMFGLGEICAASGPNPASFIPATPIGIAAGIFFRNSNISVAAVTDGTSNSIAVGERSHNLSYVTWTARSINGWLGITSLLAGRVGQVQPVARGMLDPGPGPGRAGERHPDAR